MYYGIKSEFYDRIYYSQSDLDFLGIGGIFSPSKIILFVSYAFPAGEDIFESVIEISTGLELSELSP